jgi:hypothetical protein
MTTTQPPVSDVPPSHRRPLLGDRSVTFLVTGTLAAFLAMVGLVIYLVTQVSGVANDNHTLVLQLQGVQSAATTNTINACELSNANRTEDEQIFNAILALPAIAKPQFITPANAAEQRAKVAGIVVSIHTAYAPRNCVQLYKPKS